MNVIKNLTIKYYGRISTGIYGALIAGIKNTAKE
jgi:hypothetical protein